MAGASIGTPSQHNEPPKTRRDESQRDRVCPDLLSPWTRTRFQRGSQHLHALFDQPRGRKFALESFDGGAEASSRAGDVFLDLVRRLVRVAYSTTIFGSRGTLTRPPCRYRQVAWFHPHPGGHETCAISRTRADRAAAR